MNIERKDRDSVTLVLQPEEAQRLLAGLRAHADALGAVGAELERELSALGVVPPPTVRPRMEYMPPS
jgi:hypothetical protein